MQICDAIERPWNKPAKHQITLTLLIETFYSPALRVDIFYFVFHAYV